MSCISSLISRRSVKNLSVMLMVLISIFPLFGCNKNNNPTEQTIVFSSPEECIYVENRVFSYYEAVVATDGGDNFKSYSLYRYSDTELVLVNEYQLSSESDKVSDYRIVPSSVLDDLLKLAKKYKFGKGKWVDGLAMTGKEYSIYYVKDGEQIHVSSSNMPDNGGEAFNAIYSVFSKAWKDAG